MNVVNSEDQCGRAEVESGHNRSTDALKAYMTGAALAYGICVLAVGQMFSNKLSLILELGFVSGFFAFILVGPVHLIIQLVGHLLISRFWPSRRSQEGIILNLPALVIFAYLLVMALVPWTQGRLCRSLQSHFDRPLPSSVHVNSFRLRRGMDHGSYTYLLSINPSELGDLLNNSGCVTATNSSVDFDPKSVLESVGAEFVPPYAVYVTQTNTDNSANFRMIIVGSNRTDVLFSDSFH